MGASNGAPRQYASMIGFERSTLPWRLWEKAKRQTWNPSDIDFSRDAADYARLAAPERRWIGNLAAEFMVGEEAVTLEIVPLLRAVAAEHRVDEAIYLTSFAVDEAKHVETFRRWFDAVGVERPREEFMTASYRRLFEEELPSALGRLDTDRSPEAFLDAAVTYNQFVEGVLAMTGYWTWHTVCSEADLFPGIRKGLEGIQRDERRHMAYGTYLCRRIIAAHPELWSFVEQRLAVLQPLGAAIIDETSSMFEPPYPFGFGPERAVAYAMTQVPRRLEVIEVARRERPEDVAGGQVEEDLEDELERVSRPVELSEG